MKKVCLILGLLTMMGLDTSATQPPQPAQLTPIPMIYVPPLQPDMVLSNGFLPHAGFQGTGYRMEPIHRAVSPIDYVAWHDESWNDLTVLFGKAWGWPRKMTEAQNANDLEVLHYGQFLRQTMYSYEILSPDGLRAYGSLYIIPDACGAYGAYAYYWITTPMRAEIEATFYAETAQWLNTVWPWGKTFYPGPQLSDKDRGDRYVMINYGVCI